MPYFTIEQVTTSAVENLSRAGLEATLANAERQFVNESTLRRLPPVPEESIATPPVLFDIFLSHSSLDHLQVLGIYYLLVGRHYSVYLDHICDPLLKPTLVTRATARVLRYRMAQCKSLFVATSANITHSKWVPWELGFMDGWNAKAAVLPIVPSATPVFKGQEYFDLYPEVRDSPGHIRPDDLDIYDQNHFLASWGAWLGLPRKF
ncbi:MAG: hypothetical protein ACAH88_17835 [Roseimicrobium sp.]